MSKNWWDWCYADCYWMWWHWCYTACYLMWWHWCYTACYWMWMHWCCTACYWVQWCFTFLFSDSSTFREWLVIFVHVGYLFITSAITLETVPQTELNICNAWMFFLQNSWRLGFSLVLHHCLFASKKVLMDPVIIVYLEKFNTWNSKDISQQLNKWSIFSLSENPFLLSFL